MNQDYKGTNRFTILKLLLVSFLVVSNCSFLTVSLNAEEPGSNEIDSTEYTYEWDGSEVSLKEILIESAAVKQESISAWLDPETEISAEDETLTVITDEEGNRVLSAPSFDADSRITLTNKDRETIEILLKAKSTGQTRTVFCSAVSDDSFSLLDCLLENSIGSDKETLYREILSAESTDTSCLSIEKTDSDYRIKPLSSFEQITVTVNTSEYTVELIVIDERVVSQEAQELTASLDDIEVTVTCDAEANLPADTDLAIADVNETKSEKEFYTEQIADALQISPDEITDMRLLDLSLTSNGKSVSPEADVSLSVTVHENASDVKVVALADENTVLEETEEEHTSKTVTDNLDAVYAVVLCSVTKEITASDGNTYKITAVYQKGDDGITGDAELNVYEYAPDTDAYKDYAGKSLDKLNSDNNYKARVFDISLVNPDTSEPYQPEQPVTVTIELLDDEPVTDAAIVHFNNDKAEVLDTDVTDGTCVFETTSFSPFAVVYTVDFQYRETLLKLKGGSAIRITDLIEKMTGRTISNSEIQEVLFSNSDVAWVGQADYDCSIAEVILDNGLEQVYSIDQTQEEITEVLSQELNEADWVFISLKPFATEETLTITLKNNETIVINVTDAYQPVDVGTIHSKMAKDMDVATIMIQNLSGVTATVSTTGDIENKSYDSSNYYGVYASKISPNKENRITGSVTFTYPQAAIIADGTLCDVVIKYDEIKLFTNNIVSTGSFYSVACPSKGKDKLPSLSGAIIGDNTGNARYGIEANITIGLRKADTTKPVNETYVLTVHDLNVNRASSKSFNGIYDRVNHNYFSEQFIYSGSNTVYYSQNGKMILNGTMLYPMDRSGESNSFGSGIAVLADAGTDFSFTARQSGGTIGKTTTEFYVMPRKDIDGSAITYPITSFSGGGGIIETSKKGNDFSTGNIMDGGRIGDTRTYAVPHGKNVTYRMKANDNFVLKKVTVNSAQGETDVTETVRGTLTDGYYYYHFNNVSADRTISVYWEPSEDPTIPIGHIALVFDSEHNVVRKNLGQPGETTIFKDGTPKKMGTAVTPMDFTGYKFFTFVIGEAITTPVEGIIDSGINFYGASDDLWLKYDADHGLYKYSVDNHEWSDWTKDQVPTVYAVYYKADENDKHHVHGAITGIAHNPINDEFVDPGLQFTFKLTYHTVTWTGKLQPANTTSNDSVSTRTYLFDDTHKEDVAATPITKTENVNVSYPFILESDKYTTQYAESALPETISITTQYVVIEQEPLNNNYRFKEVELIAVNDTDTVADYKKKAGIADNENRTYTVYSSASLNTATRTYDQQTPPVGKCVKGSSDQNYSCSFGPADRDNYFSAEAEFINERETQTITLKKYLEDTGLNKDDHKKFSISLRARDLYTDGKEHELMLGSYSINAVNGSEVTYTKPDQPDVHTIQVPKGAQILIAEEFEKKVAEDGHLETDYVTSAESEGGSPVVNYRAASKEFAILNDGDETGIQKDTTVLVKNYRIPYRLTVGKTYDGEDKEKEFKFHVSLHYPESFDRTSGPVKNYSLYIEEGREIKTDDNGNAEFTLSHEKEIELSIPVWAKVTVTEESIKGIKTSYTVDNEQSFSGNSYLNAKMEKDMHVLFRNTDYTPEEEKENNKNNSPYIFPWWEQIRAAVPNTFDAGIDASVLRLCGSLVIAAVAGRLLHRYR